MATIVRMPSVLAGATEAAIASWLVAPGDTVAVGTPIAEIETEKALVEYAAEQAGVVGRLVLPAGQAGEVGDPIAVLVTIGETDADIDAALGGAGAAATPPAPPAAQPPSLLTPPPPAAPAPAATPEPPAPLAATMLAPLPAPAATPAAPAPPASAITVAPPAAPDSGNGAAGPARGRVFASPLVRKIAGEKGIDLGVITGTGPGGRIVRRDLEQWLAGQPAATVPVPGMAGATAGSAAPASEPPDGAPHAGAAGTRLIPHTPMRRAIARRLTESKASTPHFYLATECVIDDLLALRAQVNAAVSASAAGDDGGAGPVRVSVNDFVVMAVAAAFRDVPEANVTWSQEGLIAHDSVDISIAVATEGGLVTPVLRDVAAKRLTQVARESADLAARARERRLHQHELEGGTFSVSNLGMYGTLEFSAIINPPQSGILAVGTARQQPIVADGAVTVATVMRCTLSVDHRAIDGALAARWLAAFTARMGSPLAAVL